MHVEVELIFLGNKLPQEGSSSLSLKESSILEESVREQVTWADTKIQLPKSNQVCTAPAPDSLPHHRRTNT